MDESSLHNMSLHTLIFKSGSITGYFRDGAYSDVRPIDLSSTPLASLPSTLIGWLGTQLVSGESISDIVLEPSTPVATEFTTTLDVQTPTSWRNTISAAVSVDSPNGARTTVVNSESLPSDLRDGILAAWQFISEQ